MTERIVILPPNWLGDAVMALPAIRDVRRHFSGAQLVVAARPSVSALFRAVPGVDDLLTLQAKASTQALGADIGILLPNSFRSAWLLKIAGVKERWGYRSDFRGLLLTKSVKRPRRKLHFGEYYQHLVRELGIETGPLTVELTVPPGKIQAAAALLQARGWTPGQTLVGLAPGAAFGHAKRWPAERFASVADALTGELGATCVLLGRDDDRDAGSRLEAAIRPDAGGRLINLIGQTDLLMLMGLLSLCRALVANDSGAGHLAAAIGIPVTAIYGPTDERYSLPLTPSVAGRDRVRALFHPVFCRPCGLSDCPIDHRCMKKIPPEQVFESVRQQLQTGVRA
ncbi:MAG TPA: lipopolysaccharide heptosyltransferase II [Vicinamibacterales bacterium]|jgi:heptosyltransferase-2|nr:lipopolysaccharide heptosyltransferase II [Vicinamibacterales bacterium]